ncbi:MAG: Stk1 family PASTA domain-containing Ser/Thr kinase [Chloroflexota bacterium]|nr:Stk1 family PASTA domain-containing Ser/Thr kinase [Chloroflexota bacterium]
MTQSQRTLNNRYELQAKIGDGGMAVVYRGFDTQLKRTVAIKILRSTYATDAEFLLRFKREAQSAASLSHPNIVNVYDVGQDNELYYIVMEYIEGTNLKEKIIQEAPLPTAQALEIAAQISDAIHYSHTNNLIHRDIKPQNVLMDRNGRVKVADFGIAKSQTDANLTQTGVTLGTVHYFSPEQAQGKPALPQSDIYSIGVVLYEMLTGRIPFESDNPIALAIKHIEEPPPPLRRFNPNIPPELEQIVLRAMNKNPNQRYRDAAAFAQVLRNFQSQASESTMAVPRTPPPTPAAPPPVNPPRPRQSQTPYREEGYPAPKPSPNYTDDDAYNAPRSREGQPNIASVSTQQNDYRNSAAPPLADDYEERRGGPGCGVWILSLSILAILLAIVVFVVFVLVPQLNQPTPTPTSRPTIGPTATIAPVGKTTVPNLVNKTQQEAENDLKAANLVAGDVQQEFKEGVDAGKVIRTDPVAGKQVDQKTRITLVISKGQDLVVLPSYSNTDLGATKKQLEELGFKVEQVQEASSTIQAGAVIRTAPAGGSDVKVAKGSKVTLYISTGPLVLPTATALPTATVTATPVPPTATPTQTTRKVQIPTNLIGLDQVLAVQNLTQLGFKVTVVQWDETYVKTHFPNDNTYSNLKVGQVLGTDPKGGTILDDGATVTVAIKK